ncbi:MAG: endonuclease/exonuclease/phosphatase family protein [Bacteriovoracaceae bacterium]|nr:endonuclease/exonuclease/phosphatase family protein [Bacteriovoracaceae bacterium]
MDASFKAITSNIRFDNPKDVENSWTHRRVLLSNILQSHHPAILATQEGREPQLRDLSSLIPNLFLVDQHREWIEERMYPCLFVDTNIFKIQSSGDFWLSETPDIAGSHSFGSAFPRLCTWMKASGFNQNWLFMCTHLDHMEAKTREAQTQVIIKKAKELKHADEYLVLMGDFNDSPASRTRELLTNHLNLFDAWSAPEESTHHPFTGHFPQGQRIDWILADQKDLIQKIYLDKSSRENLWPSDHFPVIAEIRI